jgi:hypothetical protein
MMNPRLRPGVGVLLLILCIVILTNITCKQYDYYSPQPGVLQIDLKAISNNIPFGPLNNFSLNVSSITAVRTNLSQVNIYEDLKSYQRQGSKYNTLDPNASSGSIIMGLTYVPPGDYIGLKMVLTPDTMAILDGYRVISVLKLPDFSTGLSVARNFSVSEQGTTRITFAVNLDSMLVRNGLTYTFRPYYYIESIH